jgi:hypothetical protein
LADCEFLDVVRLPGLELFRAGIVPKEEKKEQQTEQQLKIQLFFFGRRVEKKAQEIINQAEVRNLSRLLGEKVLIKFKIGEEVFKRCQQLGLLPGSKCDWDAMPQPWGYKDSQGNFKTGIWYQPAALLRLDGRDINYQILRNQSTHPQQQDAFAYFENSNSAHTNGDALLGDLEKEINAELEHA